MKKITYSYSDERMIKSLPQLPFSHHGFRFEKVEIDPVCRGTYITEIVAGHSGIRLSTGKFAFKSVEQFQKALDTMIQNIDSIYRKQRRRK